MSSRALVAFYSLIAFAVFAGLMVLFTGRAKAADLPCFRLAAVQSATAELAQQGAETTVLSGQDATSYLDALNRYPPTTHLTADSLIVVVMPGHGVSIWLVEGERACLGGKVAVDVNAKLLKMARERGA